MFSKKLQKTRVATEAVFLLLNICFEDESTWRAMWIADLSNENSQKAARRFGFTWKGF
jgi:RimJ/RimL family protein N-acetyltransferase